MTRLTGLERQLRAHKRVLELAREGKTTRVEIAIQTNVPMQMVDQICNDEEGRQFEEHVSTLPFYQQFMIWAAAEGRGTPSEFVELEVPAKPPSNICIACLRRWIHYNGICRQEKRQMRRIIECPHTSLTGDRYSCAFVKKSPPAWVLLFEVDPSAMNELYFKLCFRNGELKNSVAALIDGEWHVEVTP
jgi:hypothetical protein